VTRPACISRRASSSSTAAAPPRAAATLEGAFAEESRSSVLAAEAVSDPLITAESGLDRLPPVAETADESGRTEVALSMTLRADSGGFCGDGPRADRVHEPSCLITRRVGDAVPLASSAADEEYGRYADAPDSAVAMLRSKADAASDPEDVARDVTLSVFGFLLAVASPPTTVCGVLYASCFMLIGRKGARHSDAEFVDAGAEAWVDDA
jgi:hypothetical protein